MYNNNSMRVEPSAPPMAPGPQPHFMGPGPQAHPQQHATLNIPPMMYSVPGVIQAQPLPMQEQQPTAALKPMPQPPPAPSLNEVSLNEERQRVRCPYCYASITTKVSFRSGTMTHIAAVALLVTCFPLAWIPYVSDCCKDVEHACPNCSRSIGQFRRFN